MIDAKFDWQALALPENEAVQMIQEQFGATKLVAQILVQRGYQTPEAVQAFLYPDLENLYNPFLFKDMQTAIDRIFAAIDQGEKIVVYGDYDVDGMTATAIMTSALEIMGAEVEAYVPSRFTDGYGPNADTYAHLVDAGMQLLITVDNGVSGKTAIDTLMAQGIDVIVTDHHELPDELPNATAIIHPRLPQATPYPFPGLSGAGVAFKMASALLDAPADEMLDLAALGTIADVMDLTGENRVIVQLGLASINQNPRVGLQALFANFQQTEIDAQTAGFQIAPRLNSIGRLADAQMGVQLLLTEDEHEAQELAQKTEQLNQERKALVDEIATVALQQAETQFANDSVLVLTGANWNEGILGIVAAHVMHEIGKPTFVLTETEHGFKGSGRSLAGFDLFATLNPHRDEMVSFGGHALAAGITVAKDQVSTLRTWLNDAAVQQAYQSQQKQPLEITAPITSQDFQAETYQQLQMLGPFGQGNSEPVFELKLDQVTNVKTMSAGKHLRFTGMVQQTKIPILAWQAGALNVALQSSFQTLSVAGTLDKNTYQGATSYQFLMQDLKSEGLSLIDARTTRLTTQNFQTPATYLFFNAQIMEKLQGYIGSDSQVMFWEDAFNEIQLPMTVLVDLPDSLDELHQLLAYVPMQGVKTLFYTKHLAYLQKVPERADYVQLFKFLQNNPRINLKEQFKAMVAYLKMDELLVSLLINMFLDAKFVIMEDGFLISVDHPATADLTETEVYQKFMAKRIVEQKLIYSTKNELEQLMNTLAQKDE
ncbi:single-stranded-DNA-specific exonuclease RecJ [Weissella kandleri]|uniref:single-stranded-DNA-specific exonuclease RecJ n=1 Tax=Weissella kandleri TaxID=1616 RepID=UPI00387ED6B5